MESPKNPAFSDVSLKQFDEKVDERGDIPDWDKVPETTVWERWTYYLYYNGNNGVNNYSFVPLIIQYLATLAGTDPTAAPNTPCTTDACVVPFGPAGSLNVSSMILLSNVINFFVQSILLTSIGPLADYGNAGRGILLWVTLISCAAQIAFLAFTEAYQWWIALLIGLVVYISYGASLVFYAAIFPQLALNEKVYRDARRSGASSEVLLDIETRRRNHISTVSTAWSNIGFLLVELVMVGVFQMSNQTYANNVASAVCGVFWLVNAIPWFLVEKKRPGPPLPENANYLTYGWKQVFSAFKEARKLSQCFLYLVGYFVLSDAVNTTGQVISIIQNKVIDFDGILLTFFGLSQAITSIIGCFAFLYIQKWTGWSTKTMLQISNVATLAIPIWGCLGLNTNLNLGFVNIWEFWVYQVWFGIFTAPFYAYTQTMMSELIPAGHENMFFALFGIANRVSSFIGPIIIAAVINATNFEWDGFPICAVLQFIPCVMIAFVSMSKARDEISVYETDEKIKMAAEVAPIEERVIDAPEPSKM